MTEISLKYAGVWTNWKIEQRSNENDEELIEPVLMNIFHEYELRVREKESA